MASYCNEYINARIISVIIAGCALFVAWRNLKGLWRAQSLQAQMGLIQLENEVRKNHSQFKIAFRKYDDEYQKKQDSTLLQMMNIERTNAFELYISTADKLAALINSQFLKGQFHKRNWKDEYFAIFEEVKKCYQSDDTIISGKNT
ncbi:hypothetical protein EZS27_004755 [termite gut metagenome]|uniref:Uncharacterized protein n=1 Tax=termite gut metagenome TaxID=433724 RepID=A0A5J4SPR8_9ZZZZ